MLTMHGAVNNTLNLHEFYLVTMIGLRLRKIVNTGRRWSVRGGDELTRFYCSYSTSVNLSSLWVQHYAIGHHTARVSD